MSFKLYLTVNIFDECTRHIVWPRENSHWNVRNLLLLLKYSGYDDDYLNKMSMSDSPSQSDKVYLNILKRLLRNLTKQNIVFYCFDFEINEKRYLLLSSKNIDLDMERNIRILPEDNPIEIFKELSKTDLKKGCEHLFKLFTTYYINNYSQSSGTSMTMLDTLVQKQKKLEQKEKYLKKVEKELKSHTKTNLIQRIQECTLQQQNLLNLIQK